LRRRLPEDRITEHLASGALLRVLEDWCPPFPGFFLYYPSRRKQPAALAALVDTLRLENRVNDRTTVEGLTQFAATTILRIALNRWQHAKYPIGYS